MLAPLLPRGGGAEDGADGAPSADVELIISEDGVAFNTGFVAVRSGMPWAAALLSAVYGGEDNAFVTHPWWEYAQTLCNPSLSAPTRRPAMRL